MQQDECRLLQEMYEEYLVPLKKYAAKLGVKIDDIEDLVHETFLEYFDRYPLDWPAKLRTSMLIRILHSRWLDLNRKNRRFETVSYDDPEGQVQITQASLASGEAVNLLDQEVLDKELYRSIWNIIKDMKRDWRDVIILRLIEGLTTEETCELLEISGTVCRSRLSRAKKNLRKRLKDAGIFDD